MAKSATHIFCPKDNMVSYMLLENRRDEVIKVAVKC